MIYHYKGYQNPWYDESDWRLEPSGPKGGKAINTEDSALTREIGSIVVGMAKGDTLVVHFRNPFTVTKT